MSIFHFFAVCIVLSTSNFSLAFIANPGGPALLQSAGRVSCKTIAQIHLPAAGRKPLGQTARFPLALRACALDDLEGDKDGDMCSLECVVQIKSEEQLQSFLDGSKAPIDFSVEEESSGDEDELLQMQAMQSGMSVQEYGKVLSQYEKYARIINDVHLTSAKTGKKKHIIILEVYAPWCRKCLKMSKEVFKACKAYNDDVVFLKMNAKELPELSNKLGIRGMPTFIVFKDGERVDHFYAGTREDLFDGIGDFV